MKSNIVTVNIRRNWKVFGILATINMFMMLLKLKLRFRQKLNSLIKEN